MSYKHPDYNEAYTRRVERVCWVILAGVIVALGVIVAVAVWQLRNV